MGADGEHDNSAASGADECGEIGPNSNSAPPNDLRIGARIVRVAALELVDGDHVVRVEPKVMDLLTALARRDGAVATREDLISEIWPNQVGSDESLTRAMSQLRRALGEKRGDQSQIVTIPKRGYQLIVPVEEVASRPGSGAEVWTLPPVSRWLPWRPRLAPITAAVACVTLAGFIWLGWRGSEPRDGQTQTVESGLIEIRAIDAPDDWPLGIDVDKELSGHLVARQIKARARSAAPDALLSIPELALEGSFERRQSQSELFLNITHPSSGMTIWTHRLVASHDEIERLSRIALVDVVKTVDCALGVRDRSHPVYLSHLFHVCGEVMHWDLPAALAKSEAFVEYAPDSAAAMALLAFNAMLNMSRAPPERLEELQAIVMENGRGALAADPERALAHEAMAMALPSTGAFSERALHLKAAYAKTEPSVMIHYWLGELHYTTGRIDDAFDMAHRSIADAPDTKIGHTLLIELTARHDDLGTALEMIGPTVGWYPDEPRLNHYTKFLPALWTTIRGDQVAAEAAVETLKAIADRTRPVTFALREVALEAMKGEPDAITCSRTFVRARFSAETRASDVVEACRGQSPDRLSYMAAALGDLDLAYDLHEGVDFGPRATAPLKHLFMPELAAFRADARFMPLAHRYGLVAYWLDHDVWPDFCDAEALPYDCRAEAMRLAGAG
ncbi:MAG: winged helix-turn-helix domain-containing protein [Pseudomonadota bacterium]